MRLPFVQIQLPSAPDVSRAIETWSSADPRLALLLTRHSGPGPALRHYGLVLWEGGEVQSASQALIGAAALMPDDAPVWSDLAGVFSALGGQQEAAACAEESLARDAAQPQVWLRLGSIRMAMGDNAASADAFRQALERDGEMLDARVGLGAALVGAKRFGEAIEPLEEATKRGKAEDPAVLSLLGQAYDGTGDFQKASVNLAHASKLRPDDHGLLLKLARAQFVSDAISGTAEQAMVNCRAFALSASDVEKTARDSFHLLSAFEHRRSAIEVGELRLAHRPDDGMQTYLLAALKGEPVARAPNDYIVSFFDKFADEFDRQLVGVLGYRVPEGLAVLIEETAQRTGRAISRILDLGCGTGLAGSCLGRPDRHLVGVDLSPRMLEKARQLGCYESLVESEVIAFLHGEPERYDLVVGADLLIYFGDLAELFAGVAACLEPGGLCAFSIETADGADDIVHLSSGRFAHAFAYVDRVAEANGFKTVDMRKTTIRLDARAPAVGALVVLVRS